MTSIFNTQIPDVRPNVGFNSLMQASSRLRSLAFPKRKVPVVLVLFDVFSDFSAFVDTLRNEKGFRLVHVFRKGELFAYLSSSADPICGVVYKDSMLSASACSQITAWLPGIRLVRVSYSDKSSTRKRETSQLVRDSVEQAASMFRDEDH